MEWKWISSSHPISDIRDWSNQNRMEVRPDFQRKEVWSMAAKISLMDTILRNIPMPKIFLQAVIRKEDTYRIVIDGQQRIKAILAFLRGEIRLSKPYSGAYQDKTFSELPPAVQEEFLSYKIDINEIRNASDDIVRDIYSRVNKYTVALNKQELRRADFPGEFLTLSEELAKAPLFEEMKVFTIANTKRMGDVEFISELLALLLSGPQEKRESLDDFYLRFTEWDPDDKNKIRDRFLAVLADMNNISNAKPTDPGPVNFGEMRFKQKADFYSLFAAIDDFLRDGGTIIGKPLKHLKNDLLCLHLNTAPESGVEILREYAIKCISQGNTLASRKWRRDFLKSFLYGTYFSKHPDIDTVKLFHRTLWDIYIIADGECPIPASNCPVCFHPTDIADDITDYSTDNVFLTWKKSESVFQMTNAVFIHNKCKHQAAKDYFVWENMYTLKQESINPGSIYDR